jgi:hypothetical protein
MPAEFALGTRIVFHSGLLGSVDLLVDAANSLNLTLQGDLSGYGHVLPHGDPCHSRKYREGNGQSRRGAVDLCAANDVYVHVFVRKVDAELFRREVEALKRESFTMLPAVSFIRMVPFPFREQETPRLLSQG